MINHIGYLFFFCFFLITLNFLLKKNNLLIYKTFKLNHKKKYNNVYLSGGLYFFISSLIIFFYFGFNNNFFQNLIFLIVFISILILGILSDENIFTNARNRLLILTLILIILKFENIYFIERIDLKFFPENKFFLDVFSIFCILILINGFNFIDGTDGNISLLFSNILIILMLLSYKNVNVVLDQNIKIFIIASLVFFIFNILKINFNGDSGAYCLGFFISIFAINFYNNNYHNVSSFFIVNLLFYPAYEVLFCIIRRLSINDNPLKAGSLHIHHLLNNFIYNLSNKFNIAFLKHKYGLLTTIILNFIFFSTSYFALSMEMDHIYQLKILILNFFLYNSLYLILFKSSKNGKV